jgi:putative sigma-54 modulation protein
MQITVTTRSVESTEGIKEYAGKKLKKLERLLPSIASVQITEAKERAWFIIEITVVAGSLLVRSQERSDNLHTAIDLVIDKLELQIKKYRKKVSDRSRHVSIPEMPEPEPEEVAEAEESPAGTIVRSKRFAIKPMSADEAAAEMELLGHDFFMFTNVETNRMNVIYRRQDGNYGLIEPEY